MRRRSIRAEIATALLAEWGMREIPPEMRRPSHHRITSNSRRGAIMALRRNRGERREFRIG